MSASALVSPASFARSRRSGGSSGDGAIEDRCRSSSSASSIHATSPAIS
jgi:hypothetical protein